jgi:glyoxylase-like metal-dependent hydrolase (beta-lactamase superfamily II)
VSDRLYLRQLLAGRDFGRDDPTAAAMVNFVYLVGDADRRQCVVVDPAWDVQGILDLVDADGMELVGALGTHYHPDHVGGSMFGFTVEGVARLLELRPVKLHVHEDEADGIKIVTGLSESDLVRHAGSDRLAVGDVEIEFVHTPGHTPGSQCFLVDGRLVSGDTLFVEGCGRTDLPGGDPEQLYRSLTQRLARLPDETILLPGHDYGRTPTSTIGEQKRTNVYMQAASFNDWMAGRMRPFLL